MLHKIKLIVPKSVQNHRRPHRVRAIKKGEKMRLEASDEGSTELSQQNLTPGGALT